MVEAAPVYERPRKRWSVEDYLRLVELGVIGEDDPFELIEGEIVEKMSQNFPHIAGIRALAEALRAVFGEGFDVSQQLPIRTSDSVPEPDVLVLRGSWRDYARRFPEPHEVEIVAEVADVSRLTNDRREKLRVYARAGFPEYWIVNLVDRQLEVHRGPLPTGAYGEVRVFGPEETVRGVRVADLLPPEG